MKIIRVTVKDEFFANLNEEIVRSGSGRQLILMGDMNGRIGRKTRDTVVGNFGEDMVNDNGDPINQLHNGNIPFITNHYTYAIMRMRY